MHATKSVPPVAKKWCPFTRQGVVLIRSWHSWNWRAHWTWMPVGGGIRPSVGESPSFDFASSVRLSAHWRITGDEDIYTISNSLLGRDDCKSDGILKTWGCWSSKTKPEISVADQAPRGPLVLNGECQPNCLYADSFVSSSVSLKVRIREAGIAIRVLFGKLNETTKGWLSGWLVALIVGSARHCSCSSWVVLIVGCIHSGSCLMWAVLIVNVNRRMVHCGLCFLVDCVNRGKCSL